MALSDSISSDPLTISLVPSSFLNNIPPPSLSSIRNKWFLNLSSTTVPTNIQCLLQLGENFSLPINNKRVVIFEFIKNIERNIKKFPCPLQLAVRNHSIPLLNNLLSLSPHRNHSQFSDLIKITKSFLNDNPNLLITKADKGNITVALDKDNYMNKLNEMLSDVETYTKINKDPSKNLTSKLRTLLSRWKSLNYISDSNYKRIFCSDGLLPRAYGLPKVHKANCPFRIIISSIDSPLYELATFLHKILSSSLPPARGHVDNSFELVKNLNNFEISSEYQLISLDVVSLFTNVPVELAVNSIHKRWNFISKHCNIPRDEFVGAVRFVLDSTFFKFDNQFYKQNFGTPMGSPLSPTIADLVMQDLESDVLETIDFPVAFYYRYVDDILTAVPLPYINTLLNSFNAVHPRLNFTIEVGGDKINFLDTTILIYDNKIKFDWFHKPTFSGRYLNFLSQHPLSQKRGVIMGMVDKAFFLSHPEFHQKNLELIINILLNNDYPLDFIFKTIKTRLKYLIYNGNATLKDSTNDSESEHVKNWFTIPFIDSVSNKFRGITMDINSRLAFYSLNKLSMFIRVHKDPLQDSSKRNVVYKISCNDCNASYVGQTGRQLNTRILEHRQHIRRNTTTNSVITDHRLHCGHEFDWDNVRVLDVEKNIFKRLTSEMLYIKSQRESLNLQTDTDFLDHAYSAILDKL